MKTQQDPFEALQDWLEANGLMAEFEECTQDRQLEIIDQWVRES